MEILPYRVMTPDLLAAWLRNLQRRELLQASRVAALALLKVRA